MKVLDVIGYTGFSLVIIATPFFVYSWLAWIIRQARAEPRLRPLIPKPTRMSLLFMTPVIVTLLVGETSQSIGRDQVMNALKSFRSDYQLRVNGRPVQNPDQILAMLKTLRGVFPHHSHPTGRIDVEVSDQSQDLRLWVCRDSDNPQEYWVFYPKYMITAHNEVGRIATPFFDHY